MDILLSPVSEPTIEIHPTMVSMMVCLSVILILLISLVLYSFQFGPCGSHVVRAFSESALNFTAYCYQFYCFLLILCASL